MFSKEQIEGLAEIAAIATPVILLCAWGRFEWSAVLRTRALVNYLQFQKQNATNGDRGQRSMLHLTAHVGLTESEILQASFKSPFIKRVVPVNEPVQRAGDIFFEYDDTGNSI